MTPKDLPELPEPECASAYHAETLVYAAEEVLDIQREAYDLGARSTAAQTVEPIGPWLDDDGRAMIANSHHYTAANIKAIVDELNCLSDPERTSVSDIENKDLRTWFGVLARIITGLAHEVPTAPTASGDSTPPSPVQGDPSGALRPEPEAVGQDRADVSRDAYEGCREDLLDWKRRALKAEETCANLTRALAQEVNGPTFMGEPVVPQALPLAARDVLAERRRQVEAEGWTPEHDDEHDSGGMAIAAACYAIADRGAALSVKTVRVERLWEWTGWAMHWFKPKMNRRQNLVRAGALILAEIERLDRKAEPPQAASVDRGD